MNRNKAGMKNRSFFARYHGDRSTSPKIGPRSM